MQLTPPLFPLPVLWVAVAVLVALVNPLLSLSLVLIMPAFLYPWWLLREGRERRPSNILFAYLRLAEEAATLAGILRGYVVLRRELGKLPTRQAAAARTSRRCQP